MAQALGIKPEETDERLSEAQTRGLEEMHDAQVAVMQVFFEHARIEPGHYVFNGDTWTRKPGPIDREAAKLRVKEEEAEALRVKAKLERKVPPGYIPPTVAVLGVAPFSPDDSAEVKAERMQAADIRVRLVTAGTPADVMGIKVGDVIRKVGDRDVKQWAGVVMAVRAHKPGDEIAVSLCRGAESLVLKGKLGAMYAIEKAP